MWHVAHSYVTWLIHIWYSSFMCDMWLIHMWHGSFIYDIAHLYVTCGSFICDMAHSYMIYLIYMWHVAHSYVTRLMQIWPTLELKFEKTTRLLTKLRHCSFIQFVGGGIISVWTGHVTCSWMSHVTYYTYAMVWALPPLQLKVQGLDWEKSKGVP